ncbi:TonB-dependent receptor [Sphingomonas sp. CL5.1]|uniref:TonB-dependent receptor n=1 Tax=Sphingomonas sp. CL5.1 TaxID=2653203 RepID=UPI00158257FF|nr:TonB-dependent receptor [Sphingomonas sp. CL5.1]QKR98353.1 TonB-dependent receptor [Sphingomonas sp. CL5.1]
MIVSHLDRRHGSALLVSVSLVALATTAAPAMAQVTQGGEQQGQGNLPPAVTTTATPAASADAQSTGAATPDAAAGAAGGDVIVTARRSSERLQDVPVSVSAFGAEALAERRILTEQDLQVATPGLTVRAALTSNQINYAIRGQSIDAFSFSSPAVTTYINVVPVGGTTGTALFDLSSIQVLKGPQGTLFGRNATGGAVLYETAQPEETFGGYLKVGYGNFNDREAEGAINLPITTGVYLRLSGRYQARDGFQTNLIDGSKLGAIDSRVVRGSLLLRPEDSRFSNLTVLQHGVFGGTNVSLDVQTVNGVNGPDTYVDPSDGVTKPLVTTMRDLHGPDALGPGLGSSTDPRVNALYNGIADYIAKRQAGQAGGFYDVSINRSQRHRADQTFLSNTTTFDAGTDLTIKNIFGYNRVVSSDFIDVDGSPYDFFGAQGGPPQKVFGKTYSGDGYIFGTSQLSDEVQASGKTGNLKYIVGAFISEEKTRSYIPLTVLPDLGQPYLGSYDSLTDDKSKALYAQLSYAITPKLNATGGLRYTWEDVKIDFRQGSASDPKLLSALNEGRIKDSKPSWLVSLDYRLTDSLLVYFSHRGSWRTGGFNGTSGAAFPNPDAFRPETTYDFELGAKFAGNIGTMRGQLNVAVYDQYIHNVQRSVYIDNSAEAGNVNRARVSGVETDGNLTISRNFSIGGAFTYTDARFTDGRAFVAGRSFVFGPYADAPEFSGSAYARVASDIGEAGNVALRGEYYGQTKFYYSNLNDSVLPNTIVNGYKLINLRAEWNEIFGSQVSAAAYVSNLTGEKYYVGGIAIGQITGTNARVPGLPRTYGFELNVKF